MHIHAIALPSRYLQVSHDIVRHPRLNGTAKALLQWALSLPPGTRETLQTIGQRMPEGRIAVSKARRQLIDEGYVHIRREQSRETGTWTTDILVSAVALLTPETVAAAWTAVGGGDDRGDAGRGDGDGGSGRGDGGGGPGGVRPDDGALTVGELEAQAVGTSPKGEKTRVNTSLPAARDSRAAGGTGGADADGDNLGGGAAALFRAVAVEPRLRLGVREALALAPLVEEWLARGATERELRVAVVEGLPSRIHSPAALLRSRLERKLPPPPADLLPPPRPRTHLCGRCEAPGLSAPGVCRGCAGLPPTPAAGLSDAVAATLRGAAAVRAAVGWTRTAAAPGAV